MLGASANKPAQLGLARAQPAPARLAPVRPAGTSAARPTRAQIARVRPGISAAGTLQQAPAQPAGAGAARHQCGQPTFC
eukprot:11300438-Alexandrium_andersonii.AAC.1